MRHPSFFGLGNDGLVQILTFALDKDFFIKHDATNLPLIGVLDGNQAEILLGLNGIIILKIFNCRYFFGQIVVWLSLTSGV